MNEPVSASVGQISMVAEVIFSLFLVGKAVAETVRGNRKKDDPIQ